MFKYGHVFWFSGQHNLFQEVGNFVRTFINITAGLSSHSSCKCLTRQRCSSWRRFLYPLSDKGQSREQQGRERPRWRREGGGRRRRRRAREPLEELRLQLLEVNAPTICLLQSIQPCCAPQLSLATWSLPRQDQPREEALPSIEQYARRRDYSLWSPWWLWSSRSRCALDCHLLAPRWEQGSWSVV